MKEAAKNILRPITPNIVKKIYKSFSINLDNYTLLPKKDLTYATDQLYTFHNADFMKDPLFIESYNLAKRVDNKHCLAKNDIPWRMHVLYWAGTYAKNIPGDFVDCGVNTGFCARSLMHYIGFEKLDKKYFLMDTFGGLDPKYSTEEEMKIHKTMHYDQQDLYETVKKTFEGFNAEVIKGTVPETLPLVQTDAICFLHLDMNAALPEVSAIDFFWKKISKGGVILFDDYSYEGNHAMKEAHDTWAKKHGVQILSLPTGQGLIIKNTD
ncbi:MAG TPA: TylF/MycF/NovP-related O-methyltransferase [Candidatus Paceibacterota bacterium]|nr:TylF/MycF/NovP-related O-methyltransferase [Candidatus Paceibacterota bacterium]